MRTRGWRAWKRARAGATKVSATPGADGLVTLGTDPRARDQLWHLPVNPAESSRATMSRIGEELGYPVAATSVPGWLVRALGVFSPMMREVAEMMYQWRAPFILDDRRYRARFGAGATPWSRAIPATVAWARDHYGGAVRRAA